MPQANSRTPMQHNPALTMALAEYMAVNLGLGDIPRAQPGKRLTMTFTGSIMRIREACQKNMSMMFDNEVDELMAEWEGIGLSEGLFTHELPANIEAYRILHEDSETGVTQVLHRSLVLSPTDGGWRIASATIPQPSTCP